MINTRIYDVKKDLKQKNGLSYPCRTEDFATYMRMGMGKEAKANKIVMLNFDVDVREMYKNIKQRQKKIHE